MDNDTKKLIESLKSQIEQYKRDAIANKKETLRFKAIANTHPKLLAIIALDGTILYVNRVSSGYNMENIIHDNVWSYIPEEYKPAFNDALEYVRQNKTSYFIDLPSISSTGSPIWWAIRLEPIEYDGEVREFLIERTDITIQKNTISKPERLPTRYKTLFENISNGVAIMQAIDNGNDFLFLDFNRAAEKIDQISRYDVLSKTLFENFPGIKECGLLEIFKRVWQTGKPEYYPTLLYKDKRISNWRKGYAYKLPTGELIHVFSDETQRMEIEYKLKLTEFSVKYSGIPTYWILPSSKIFHVNEAACKMLGYTYEELTSMRVLDIDSDLDEELWQKIWNSFKKNKYYQSERQHKAKNGQLFNVEIDSSYCKLGDEEFSFSFIRDTTERKKAEKELRKFKLLADNANFGMTICDLNREILYANNYFAQRHGYTVDELLGKDILILHSDDSYKPLEEITQQLITNFRFEATEIHHIRKDGTSFPLLISGSVITDEDNQPQFIGISSIDITEHKKLEEQLTQTHKLEAIGKLAGGIAHDFNNYLTGILGYSNLLLEKCSNDKKMLAASQTIVKAAEQASELTKQLLGFARKGKHQNIPVNIHDTLNDVLKLVFRTSHKNIRISQNFSAKPVHVMGDPVQLQQVFLNLVINANDAMRDGGDLIISIDKKKLSQRQCRQYPDMKPGTYAMISIEDTGHGIPANLQESIFEPFFTTKAKGEGSGMGLAVVYGIVKNHAGTIQVKSKEGKGTTFTVYLPKTSAKMLEKTENFDILKPIPGSGFIVVVDDDEISRTTLCDMLEHLGYTVVDFSNPRDTIRFYKHHKNDIHIVIVDMNMPQMSGKECIEALTKINKKVKTLLTTGYDKNGIYQELNNKYNVGFIQKPYHLLNLSHCVAHMMQS